VNDWLLIPAAELHERFSRSSGPGGQSVNTADSRVELSFDVEHSSALPEWARLAGLLRDAVAPPQRPRIATRPGRAANERRLEAKRNRAAIKRTRRYDDRHPD